MKDPIYPVCSFSLRSAADVFRGILLCATLSFAVGGCFATEEHSSSEESIAEVSLAPEQSVVYSKMPSEKMPSEKVPSDSGAYLITLRPENDKYLIGTAQAWIATITDANGQVFTPTALYFDGGMPGHGHGLPSAPRFTKHLGGADFLLEGMRLNMPGDWRFVVSVGGPAGTDSAVFNLNIQPGPVSGTGVAATETNPQGAPNSGSWSSEQLALIESLKLQNLPAVADTSNRLLGNAAAIELGKLLFSETGLSGSGDVSCATCHQQEHGFADGKRFSFGSKQATRHTPTLLGVSHANWFYWDGRRDSLWAQALTPIETIGEMDNNRTDVVRYIASHSGYADAFKALAGSEAEFFAELSDKKRFPSGASPFGSGKLQWHRMLQADRMHINRAYATLGKIIASYEATLQHQPAKFDLWASSLHESSDADSSVAALSSEEQAGLNLFLDLPKTQCLRCHNGALFTNQGFHNVATAESLTKENSKSAGYAKHDFGRMLGLQSVIVDPFNCSGEFSDAPQEGCDHLRFARRQNLGETIDGAFKVPSLRNLNAGAPYFHDGRFATLEEVIDHYRNQNGGDSIRVSEVPDIDISDAERDQLVAFLNTL